MSHHALNLVEAPPDAVALGLPTAVEWPADFSPVDPDPIPLQQLEQQERTRESHAIILGFLKSLTPNQRQVVVSIFWWGMTQTEVGRAMRITQPAVSALLRRALTQGRHDLEPFCKTHFGY